MRDKVDKFTQDLIELSYQTVKARQRKKSDAVTVNDLIRQIGRHWVNYRDGIVAIWANRIYAKARQHRLVALTERVYDLLAQHGEYWEFPYEDDPPERWAEFSASGVAALHWIHLEIADKSHSRWGKATVPRYTREELVAWLSERQLDQLPLFQL